MNQQPISKQHLHRLGKLQVNSIFHTIQGEGPHVGTPAVFIRLAGCNLRCPGCDTEYTKIMGDRAYTPIRLVGEVQERIAPGGLVVLTGGEPFRQNIAPLAHLLVETGFRVQVETNGTLDGKSFPFLDCTIVCSPKTGSLNKELLPNIDAFKYVLHADHMDPKDGLPTEVLGSRVRVARPPAGFTGRVYVQPMDTQDPKENLRHRDAAVQSCLRHGYTLCLQIHKLLGLE